MSDDDDEDDGSKEVVVDRRITALEVDVVLQHGHDDGETKSTRFRGR